MKIYFKYEEIIGWGTSERPGKDFIEYDMEKFGKDFPGVRKNELKIIDGKVIRKKAAEVEAELADAKAEKERAELIEKKKQKILERMAIEELTREGKL